MTIHHEDADVGALVLGARRGDAASWEALVGRFGGLVWTVARSFQLNDADSADVSSIVWLRLAEHLDRIAHPHRVGAWLVTTARRECIRQRRLANREAPDTEAVAAHHRSRAPSADAPLLRRERDAALQQAFLRLPERSRLLLIMLLSDPPMSYAEIADALDMPVGSIGPTRARVLAALRKDVEDSDISGRD